MWSRLFPCAPLPRGVGPGVIGRKLTENLLAKGEVCYKFRENYFFSEICGIMSPTRQFGYKGKLSEFILGKRYPQNQFFCGG